MARRLVITLWPILFLVLAQIVVASCTGRSPPPPGGDAGSPADAGASSDGGDAGGAPTDGGLDAGACGGACMGATPYCNVATQHCVACLSSPLDTCDSGTYCDSSFTCQRGCKVDADCSGGSCLGSHDCTNCAGDQECSSTNRCGTGVCAPPCDGGNPCTAGTCCGGACVDTTQDVNDCGGCGIACGSQQFCTGTACVDALVSNICTNPSATGILHGASTDDTAAAQLVTALESSCAPPTDGGLVWQTDGGVIDYRTGAPVVRGGRTLIAPGGWYISGGTLYGQRLVAFLEQQGYTPVVDASDATNAQWLLRDGGAIVGPVPYASITQTDDYCLIEVVRDPVRGTLSFVVYGIYAGGTAAGSWYAQNVLFPNLSTATKQWYVFHWQEADGGTGPSAADTWTLLGSGP